MFCTFLFAFPAIYADEKCTNKKLERETFQTEAVLLLMQNVDLEPYIKVRSVCEWGSFPWKSEQSETDGKCEFTCIFKVLFEISISMVRVNLNIRFLSPTVQICRITDSFQKYKLRTRALPRELRTFDMSYNLLYGSIDLSALPARVKSFNVMGNELSGSISLLNPPPLIKYINLRYNHFSNRVVHVHNLPKSLTKVLLDGNSVKTVSPLFGDIEVKKRLIFICDIQRNKDSNVLM